MRVRGTRVDLQLLQHRVAERAFGQHTFDRHFQHATRVTRLELGKIGGGNAAGISAVPVVKLGARLAAGHAQLIDIDHDDIIAIGDFLK